MKMKIQIGSVADSAIAMSNDGVARRKETLSCPICGSEQVSPYLSAPDRFHLRAIPYELVRCGSCCLVWQKNPPRPEEIGQHYGSDYHKSITSAGDSSPKRWALQNRTIANFKKGGSLLDLGCSAGAFLSTMRRDSWQLHGIEISPNEARRAEERTGAKVFVGDILDAPFAPTSFDVITCFDVLEHLYEPRKIMEKLRVWLKPGGIFYMAVPNIASWESHLFKGYWFGLELPRHLFLYSPPSVRKLAEATGLKELHCSTPPASYAENSFRYIWDHVLLSLSVSRQPLAVAGDMGLPGRIVRKGFRITLLDQYRRLASWCGAGPVLEMILQKPGDLS